MRNVEIRELMEKNRLKHWEVAEQIGIDASSLSRWLRVNLTKEREEKIIKAIEDLSK